MEEVKCLGLQMRMMLGSGSFAQVYQCYDHKEQKAYAVKLISKQSLSNSRARSFVKEAEILGSLEHRNVVKFYAFKETQKYLLIKMELVKGGTLKKLMEQRRNSSASFSEEEVALFLMNLLEGIRYLHGLNIIHRDLKPENILFEDNSDLSSVKIVDFGLSAKFQTHNPAHAKAQCGTLLYMAPQIFNKPSYTKTVDIWSCAIIMYMLLNQGNHPFYSAGMKVQDFKLKLKYANFPELKHPMAQNFLQKISKREYEQRYNVNQALKHPFITRNKDDQIPLSIHQNYKGFDSTSQTISLLKLFLAIGAVIPHNRKKIDQFYRFRVNDFANNNEAVRVMSPSRRKMRDKNNQLFIKMKQIFHNTNEFKRSQGQSEPTSSVSQQNSPTLKKHQSYFMSLFERQKSYDLMRPRQKLELRRVEQSQSSKSEKDILFFQQKDDYFKQIENSQHKEEHDTEHKMSDRRSLNLMIDRNTQLKIQNQIEQSVNSLQHHYRNDTKRKIFQKKPSFDDKQLPNAEKRATKLVKKYSHIEESKTESINKSNANFSLSNKQIYTRRAMSPLRTFSKPMVFSISTKNTTHRK